MSKPKLPDLCRLTITIRGEHYTARPLRADDPEVARVWRLRKADGTAYEVADGAEGQTCTCGDYVYRRQDDPAGCKHVRSLRALGLIDPDGDDAHDWPNWCDHLAVTTSR